LKFLLTILILPTTQGGVPMDIAPQPAQFIQVASLQECMSLEAAVIKGINTASPMVEAQTSCTRIDLKY